MGYWCHLPNVSSDFIYLLAKLSSICVHIKMNNNHHNEPIQRLLVSKSGGLLEDGFNYSIRSAHMDSHILTHTHIL